MYVHVHHIHILQSFIYLNVYLKQHHVTYSMYVYITFMFCSYAKLSSFFFFIVHLHPIFLDHKKAVFTFNFLCASTAYFLPHTLHRIFFYYMSSHFCTHNFLCLYPSWQQQKKFFFSLHFSQLAKKCLEWE